MAGNYFWGRASGLSPRVRGSQMWLVIYDHKHGSIPARAGEPRARAMPIFSIRVYPRACGGAQGGQMLQFFGPGLSPRVRGSLSLSTA